MKEKILKRQKQTNIYLMLLINVHSCKRTKWMIENRNWINRDLSSIHFSWHGLNNSEFWNSKFEPIRKEFHPSIFGY